MRVKDSYKQIMNIVKYAFGGKAQIGEFVGAGYTKATSHGFAPVGLSAALMLGADHRDERLLSNACMKDMGFIMYAELSSVLVEKWVIDELMAVNPNCEYLFGFIRGIGENKPRYIHSDAERFDRIDSNYQYSGLKLNTYSRRQIASIYNCSF